MTCWLIRYAALSRHIGTIFSAFTGLRGILVRAWVQLLATMVFALRLTDECTGGSCDDQFRRLSLIQSQPGRIRAASVVDLSCHVSRQSTWLRLPAPAQHCVLIWTHAIRLGKMQHWLTFRMATIWAIMVLEVCRAYY